MMSGDHLWPWILSSWVNGSCQRIFFFQFTGNWWTITVSSETKKTSCCFRNQDLKKKACATETTGHISFLQSYLSICCYFTYIMHQRLAVYWLSIDGAAAGWLWLVCRLWNLHRWSSICFSELLRPLKDVKRHQQLTSAGNSGIDFLANIVLTLPYYHKRKLLAGLNYKLYIDKDEVVCVLNQVKNGT